jgi:uncharacterized membrane protein YbaN (DUF454 family)
MQVFIDYIGELNWLAVFVAAFVAFLSGAIWYSNILFGKKWQKAVGLTDKEIKNANMTEVMGVSAVTVIVSAVAIGLLVKVLVLTDVYQGALFGAMVAVGILGTNKLMQVKFERRPMTYWYITLGADIIALSIMGAVLSVWQ